MRWVTEALGWVRQWPTEEALGTVGDMAGQFSQVEPVCVAISGRAGVGRSTLVDALVGSMAALGPLTIGELPASNDPMCNPERIGQDVPIDIVVHMVFRMVQASDRHAIRGYRRRGIPVVGVLARADLVPDCWAVAARCRELVLLPVGREPLGVGGLVDCLSVGIGEILAARADRQLARVAQCAVEGGVDGAARDPLERELASAEALRLRMTGAANWDRSEGVAERALAEAARWRALANQAQDPAEAERARNWHRRHVARAVQLGAGFSSVGYSQVGAQS